MKRIVLSNIVITFLSISLFSCNSTKQITQEHTDIKNVILNQSLNPKTLIFNTFIIKKVSIKDNILSLYISYTGGCKKHSFDLISKGEYTKSLPRSLQLYIKHNNNDDNCTENIKESFNFNISSLKLLNTQSLSLKITNYEGRVLYEYEK